MTNGDADEVMSFMLKELLYLNIITYTENKTKYGEKNAGKMHSRK